MFATTALFSQVILYYYTDAFGVNQLAILSGACKLLNAWANEKENNSMKSKSKPRLIFIRRNVAENQINESPIDGNNRTTMDEIKEHFELDY